MKTYSLRFKLTTAFLGITLGLFAFISIFANFVLENQFKAYTISKQEKKITAIVTLVNQKYDGFGQKWDTMSIEAIGMNALEEGLILRVERIDSTIVWDARTHNNGMCTSILEHMAVNMQSVNAGSEGGYVEKSYPVTQGGTAVGTVTVGYWGPYSYSDNDVQFLATLNQLLFWGAVVSLAVCVLLGAYMARRFSQPIAGVIRTAEKIADGEFDVRSDEKTNTKEIIALSGSIHTLASSLGEQERLRKRLTADVAHELRTPLATLQSHVEAMIDGVWEPDEKRLASLHQEIVRLNKMVGELQKLSLYEGENLVLECTQFDLSELIESILLHFESEFKNKNVSLQFIQSEQQVYADRDKIRQVLINLISNALKYTPSGGTVVVETTGGGSTVQAIVTDTGIGIAGEDLPYIFERFYRTDESRSRLTGGAGIGLTIARSIVQAHGGTLTAESEKSQGSRFVMTLPRLSAGNGMSAASGG